jgi:regulator of nucleoside diphosphate kinase
MNIETPIIVTELDAARIRDLGARLPAAGHATHGLRNLLEQVAQEADIVASPLVADDVVTMNSTVSFAEAATGSVHRVTVVYPWDASVADRRISVLSPVGRALLGRRTGDASSIDMPDGTWRSIRLGKVHYQPEANGDYTR